MGVLKRIAKQQKRRRFRVRNRLRRDAAGKPRLSVHRSGKHIYAQLIDDVSGTTLASANTLQSEAGVAYGGNAEAAKAVGKLIAERAAEKGVSEVVFDRGVYKYHGRVAALADSAREHGLKF